MSIMTSHCARCHKPWAFHGETCDSIRVTRFLPDEWTITTNDEPTNNQLQPPMPRQNPILTVLQRDLADAIERQKTAIREQLERFGKLVRKKTVVAKAAVSAPTLLNDGIHSKTTTTP